MYFTKKSIYMNNGKRDGETDSIWGLFESIIFLSELLIFIKDSVELSKVFVQFTIKLILKGRERKKYWLVGLQ